MATADPSFDIVVVGGANMDYLVRGRELPQPGQTLEGEEFQQAPGGKGANQAVACRRLGASVLFVGRIGADEQGRIIQDRLSAERIGIAYLVEDPNAGTGAAVIQVDSEGRKQILTAPGANCRLGVEDVRRAKVGIANARLLLTQLEVPIEALKAAIELANQAGVRVALDPSPAVSLSDDLLRQVYLCKPDSKEAQVLTGVAVRDRDSARLAAQQLLKRGVKVVAIEAGNEGNLILSEEGEWWFPLIAVRSVDATGAGDAFMAALAVSLVEGRGWAEAGSWASAAAALKTTRLGAQAGLARREEVEQLARKINVKPGPSPDATRYSRTP